MASVDTQHGGAANEGPHARSASEPGPAVNDAPRRPPHASSRAWSLAEGHDPAGRLHPSRAPWSVPSRLQRSIDAWGRSDRGRVRHSNEDCYLVAALDRTGQASSDASPGMLLLVADGVGGRPGGEIASAIAVDAMACYVQTVVPWVLTASEQDRERLDAWLHDALRRTQARMRRFALRRGLDPRMATTFTMACVTGSDLVVAHIGDSRCYLARDGGIERLTVDHTLAQKLIEDGQLTEKQLERSPYAHMLVNALGGSSDELSVDLSRTRLEPGDQLLLCSDGLTRHLSDAELAEHLAERRPVDTTVDDMVGLANERGGSDNITVVIARP